MFLAGKFLAYNYVAGCANLMHLFISFFTFVKSFFFILSFDFATNVLTTQLANVGVHTPAQ